MISDDIKYKNILPYNKKYNYYMQLEGIARYQYATDFLQSKGLKDVLDVGCYNGFGCEILAEKASSVYGIDINKRFITLANMHKEKYKVKNVEYERVDIQQDISNDRKFDLITCFDTLAYIEDNKTVIRRMLERLTDDGYMIVSVPCERFEPLKPDGTSAYPGHVHFYKPNKIKKMFTDAGFEVVERLGQSNSNIMLNLEYFIIRKYELPERKVKSYYTFEKSSMQYFARLIAYPSLRCVDDSYSIVLVLRKKK